MIQKIPLHHSKVYLIDTSSLIFRAYYAIPELSSHDGTPVNALYGFISMVFKLLLDQDPQHLIFCLDSKEKGERYTLYPEYKAQRKAMPESLAVQIPLIETFLHRMGLPKVQASGVEADDIIGTLVHLLKEQNNESIIVSGDKDFAQLIQEQVSLYDTMKNIFYDPTLALKKWGVKTHQMVDYLALVGDSSDNIPGVTGIGPKTAISLLTEFSDLKTLYSHLPQVKDSVRKRLIENQKEAFLSQQLVQINTRIPLESLNLSCEKDFLPQPVDEKALLSFLKHYDFKSLESVWQKIRSSCSLFSNNLEAYPKKPASELRLQANTFDKKAFSQWIESYQGKFWIHLDQDEILLGRAENFFIIPFECHDQCQDLLSQKSLSGFHVKEIAHKIRLPQLYLEWDHALAFYLLHPGESLNFQDLVTRFLNPPPELPESSESPECEDIPYWILKNYEDLETLFLQKFENSPSQKYLFYHVELPLASLLYKMEIHGVLLDTDWLIAESISLFKELTIIEKQIYDQAQTSFNINSPKQLAQVLFEDLKLPPKKKIKTGYSTDNEVLESLRLIHPIIDSILQYRELSKLKSTYVDPFPQMVDSQGRIHTTFQQMVTSTGRLSSTNPNLQNIPIKTQRGERLRTAFIVPQGFLMGAFDYSQIELRILAHLSEDPALIHAFEKNQDVHQATASEIFHVSLDSVTSEQRRMAKAVNFGIIYGQSAFGLAQSLGISRGESQDIIDRYFQKFSRIQDYMKSCIAFTEQEGYSETLLGRKRLISPSLFKKPMTQKMAERLAVNSPIQGSAADIVKLAMVEVSKKIQSSLILQVHDELIFEAPEDLLKEEAPKIQQIMETVLALKVPLIVHFRLGVNWKESH
jgi:DNA polymerase I